MNLDVVFNVFVVLAGFCVGSFLNVCIYRLPKGKSAIFPRSFCPKCNTPIKWYDNIPLLSYIILKCRCRNCQEKISLRYPIVELITGVLFLGLYLQVGLSWIFAKYIFFFSILVLVSFIDIEYHAIPAYLCVAGIVIGLAFSLPASFHLFKNGVFDLSKFPVVAALKGLLFGLGFTYLFKLFGDVFIDFYLTLRKKDSIEGERESLGLGDVDFMGMVGVFLGMKGVVLTFFLAPFFAIIYSIFALIFKKSHLIPYLPYLSLAALVAFFWGNTILQLVLGI